MTVAVAELEAGQRGRLIEGGAAPGSRLYDLGFVPGTEVRMVRRAPLGDPVELELRGYRICLRARDLAALRVERLA